MIEVNGVRIDGMDNDRADARDFRYLKASSYVGQQISPYVDTQR